MHYFLYAGWPERRQERCSATQSWRQDHKKDTTFALLEDQFKYLVLFFSFLSLIYRFLYKNYSEKDMLKLLSLLALLVIANCGIVLTRQYILSRQWTWESPTYPYRLLSSFYDNGTVVIGNKPPMTYNWWFNSTVFLYQLNNDAFCEYPTLINQYNPGKYPDVVLAGRCTVNGQIIPSSFAESS